ncbi:MAG: family 43 glycosylhydrolase [Spirochaetales bacterium]|nr:family 43 glycosylhydrolase [Spirochaetales bacterium]
MLKSITKMKRLTLLIVLVIGMSICCYFAFADNPLITTDYYADPSCRVFNGTMYVYGSHDIDDPDWYKMRDYHVWSSTNGVKWTDHGVALDKNDVPWVDQSQDTMWAPDCVYKNGTYYFYFPVVANGGGRRIGVATASNPEGPFNPQPNYMANVNGIDPCIYFADNGDAYMYWSMTSTVWVARLNSNMLSLATSPTAVSIQGVPSFNLIEGPWVHEYNNTIYLSVPISLTGGPEVMDYATGTSPTGPFTYRGRIFDPNVNWTIHGSIVNFNDHWYAFYHDDALSGSDHGRCWRAEEFQYNANGTIPKLSKTLRGIGTANAYDQIQVDRYNTASSGIQSQSVGGGEPRGWYIGNISNGSWIQYNNVDFTNTSPGTISARVASQSGGGSIEVRLNSTTGTLLGTISVPATGGSQTWRTVTTDMGNTTTGTQNLYLVFRTGGFNVNWIQFEGTAAPTGVPTPGPTGNQAPIFTGGPYSLNGTSDYVDLPDGLTNDLNDFSIACRVNLNSRDTWTRIFDFGGDTDIFMMLTPESGDTGYPYFCITLTGNSGEQGLNGNSALPTGSWQHFTVTRSGSTGILYINGQEVDRNNNMTLHPADMGNTLNNYIGRSQWSNDPYLNGEVDDFFVYNRALSPSEVAALADPAEITPDPTPTPTTPPEDCNVFFDPAHSTQILDSTFRIDVVVDSGNQELAAYGFNITYDPAILHVAEVEKGVDGFLAAANTETPGEIIASGFDSSGTGPGSDLQVLIITFNGIAEGISSLGLYVDQLVDGGPTVIGTACGTDGSIEVKDTILRGDINGDGVIDIIDALLIAKCYVDIEPERCNLDSSDTNCDGKIDIIDALLVAQYYVELIQSFC